MEARIDRLEADVAHLRDDVADIRADVRTLRDKLDALRERMDAKFDAVHASLAGIRSDLVTKGELAAAMTALKNELKAEIASARVWPLLLYFALAAAMLGTMARGFGWI
jgi:uncharacterized coiled-coil protein SlyX